MATAIESLTPLKGTRPFRLMAGLHHVEMKHLRKIVEPTTGKMRLTHHVMKADEDGNNILWSDVDLEAKFKNKWQLIPESVLPKKLMDMLTEVREGKQAASEETASSTPIPAKPVTKDEEGIPEHYTEVTDNANLASLNLRENGLRVFKDTRKLKYLVFEEDNLEKPINENKIKTFSDVSMFVADYLKPDPPEEDEETED